ncbi:Retrovirus-related Pol polyprotein from transposon 297 [Araneus ventricosus]|uniref:Retrovirus-related Pol polyprotein from transposon 297 n=1 Tax=Araneus ventricosus TaxID=182803 RepID=A0A4Y2D9F6_ARAVE|nr:Retrovirus-related Pol polyprotein from transposon 297 [Araneus ventricosus]
MFCAVERNLIKNQWILQQHDTQTYIARPLSNLTKKNIVWKWSEQEQQAFQTLKQRLVTPPVLRQVDITKPFIIRTDASGYALCAVLLQGDSPADERPIEYASRLLSSAEKNYSATEREALAVVWAFDKFRGYIEGADIIVASDHQPLKWLMTLSSPTGRLARWALQI